jgi:hypothetical protein
MGLLIGNNKLAELKFKERLTGNADANLERNLARGTCRDYNSSILTGYAED